MSEKRKFDSIDSSVSSSPPPSKVVDRNAAAASSDDFDFDIYDLISDKSLWDLYGRWCAFHGKERDDVEKKERFHFFKMNAKLVFEHNVNRTRGSVLALNKFGDGEWMKRPNVPDANRRTQDFFSFDQKDFESEENLLALYDRWCVHEGINRTSEEKEKKLAVFRENAECLYEHNLTCPLSMLDLGVFGDHKDSRWVKRYTLLLKQNPDD